MMERERKREKVSNLLTSMKTAFRAITRNERDIFCECCWQISQVLDCCLACYDITLDGFCFFFYFFDFFFYFIIFYYYFLCMFF